MLRVHIFDSYQPDKFQRVWCCVHLNTRIYLRSHYLAIFVWGSLHSGHTAGQSPGCTWNSQGSDIDYFSHQIPDLMDLYIDLISKKKLKNLFFLYFLFSKKYHLTNSIETAQMIIIVAGHLCTTFRPVSGQTSPISRVTIADFAKAPVAHNKRGSVDVLGDFTTIRVLTAGIHVMK